MQLPSSRSLPPALLAAAAAALADGLPPDDFAGLHKVHQSRWVMHHCKQHGLGGVVVK